MVSTLTLLITLSSGETVTQAGEHRVLSAKINNRLYKSTQVLQGMLRFLWTLTNWLKIDGGCLPITRAVLHTPSPKGPWPFGLEDFSLTTPTQRDHTQRQRRPSATAGSSQPAFLDIRFSLLWWKEEKRQQWPTQGLHTPKTSGYVYEVSLASQK